MLVRSLLLSFFVLALAEPALARDDAWPVAYTSVAHNPADALAELPIDELIEQRYRRYRALGAYTEVARPEVPGRVDRSLADRLRDLLDPARRGLVGVEGWSRDEDPPAREEV
jgi:hypothetical protein